MELEKEIEKVVRCQFAISTKKEKSPEQISAIVNEVKISLYNSEYDFSNSNSFILRHNGKKRFVKQYSEKCSVENILSQCIKKILDRTFKVKYPNRNTTVKSIFSILSAVKDMSDFTIVKFDFKDYFNSVSTVYLFEYILKHKLLNRFEANLVKNFCKQTKYAYAGLSTSNAMAEIIAKYFDEAIKQNIQSKRIIFFERYIDDSVLIINEHVDKEEIKDILNKTLVDVFQNDSIKNVPKCKTQFNDKKFRYISRRGLGGRRELLDYLGYQFLFSTINSKVSIQYGITSEKQEKYNKRIDKFILEYQNSQPLLGQEAALELLRHRIAAFTSRTVYLDKKFRSNIWKVKGFISNYGELRHVLDTGLLDKNTKKFLKNMIINAFRRAKIEPPYFLKGSDGIAGYNLFENMKVNKTILLVNHIGHNYNSLKVLCNQVGMKLSETKRGYSSLVREYLIHVKVGY